MHWFLTFLSVQTSGFWLSGFLEENSDSYGPPSLPVRIFVFVPVFGEFTQRSGVGQRYPPFGSDDQARVKPFYPLSIPRGLSSFGSRCDTDTETPLCDAIGHIP